MISGKFLKLKPFHTELSESTIRKISKFEPILALKKKQHILRPRLACILQGYYKCDLCPERCRINRIIDSDTCPYHSKGYKIKINNSYCLASSLPNNNSVPSSPKEIASIVNSSPSVKCLIFSGLEPTHNILPALETIKYLSKEVTIVWHTKLYVTKKALNFLKDLVDIYIISYGQINKDYWDIFTNNLSYLVKTQPFSKRVFISGN